MPKKHIETGAIDSYVANSKPKKNKIKKNNKKVLSENSDSDEDSESEVEKTDNNDQELQENIQKYIKVDNTIKKIQEKMKILRESIKPKMETKKKYEKKVTKGMKKSEIKVIKIDDGKLLLNESTTKESLNPPYILKILKKNINNKEKVKKIFKKLTDDRPEKNRHFLKRATEKNTYKNAKDVLSGKKTDKKKITKKKKSDQSDTSSEE